MAQRHTNRAPYPMKRPSPRVAKDGPPTARGGCLFFGGGVTDSPHGSWPALESWPSPIFWRLVGSCPVSSSSWVYVFPLFAHPGSWPPALYPPSKLQPTAQGVRIRPTGLIYRRSLGFCIFFRNLELKNGGSIGNVHERDELHPIFHRHMNNTQ